MNKGLWLQSGLSAPTLVIEMDSDDEDYQCSDGGTSDENENEIDANEASFRSALTEGSGDKRSRSGSSPGEIESGRNSLSDGGYRLLEAEDGEIRKQDGKPIERTVGVIVKAETIK